MIATPFGEENADISPDGRWIAYNSNDSGRDEIYVRPFPAVDGGRWQISNGGGMKPVWARNGKELFYVDVSGAGSGSTPPLAVPILSAAGATFQAGNPTRLISTRYLFGGPTRNYDVGPDGRFLMIKEDTPGIRRRAPRRRGSMWSSTG